MSAVPEILVRIDDRLKRIEAELELVRGEVQSLSLRQAASALACARCAIQLSEAETEPPEAAE